MIRVKVRGAEKCAVARLPQNRILSQQRHKGSTLRENLGLKRPENRLFVSEAVRKAG
ncbi:hypothetical protein [Mesorhizobium sp. CA4]|uniref:hypothetical protein n=1 Tax=Mesorhizobium sp. CA4 TaxID=588499 RepID=UPI001CD13048|nr:hypothetical protein [Mesorhizobium sp. CA4]MBZ9821229.1 hypothetical protein [Mesorhizobium sp. CA4]